MIAFKRRSPLEGLVCLIIAFLIFLPACASVTTVDEIRQPSLYPSTQITLFLNGPSRSFKDITFHVDSISLLDERGAIFRLVDSPLKINSIEVRGKQLKLSERSLPEGKYVAITIVSKRALVRSSGGEADLSVQDEENIIPVSVTVNRNQATAIFLSWEADSSIVDDFRFKPILYARAQEPGLTSLMLYVTNEDSHNVYAINRHTNEVESVILVGKSPKGIAANTISTDRKLFVANSEANTVSVIDARKNLVETEVPLRFGREPVALAAAKLSPVSENIYVANYRTNNVSVLDGRTYQEIERIDVGIGPTSVAADPAMETIAASPLSASDMETLRNYRQRYLNIYVANKNDRSISVLKVNGSTGRTESVYSVPVEWTPVKVFVDYPSATVYGVHRDCDCISAINIVQLIRGNVGGAVSYLRSVGFLGMDIAVDRTMNRIYFLKESPNEVTILRPMQSVTSMQTGTPSLMGIITAGTKPWTLSIDPESRKLYMIDRASESLIVVDKTTRTQEREIPLGRRPHGVSMFED